MIDRTEDSDPIKWPSLPRSGVAVLGGLTSGRSKAVVPQDAHFIDENDAPIEPWKASVYV